MARARRWRRWLWLLLLPLLLLLADWWWPLPNPYSGRHFAQVVTAADGQPLRAFADDHGVWRYPVSQQQVAPAYIEALLNYEDRHFYRHPGINPLAMGRAAWQWLRHGQIISGGSTLTMQVARLLEPRSRTVGGKLRQMARALQLEWHLSKAEILDLYLNLAPYGGNLEGVQAASYAYFGRPAADLSDGQAALLAVLPQAPSRWRPDRHPERAIAARHKLLNRLLRFGIWSPERVAQADGEPLLSGSRLVPMLAPHLAEYLSRQYPERATIVTTLNADLQQRLETLVSRHLRRFDLATSAAVMVVDNASGGVLAYVGAGRYGERRHSGYIDMVRAPRSPGSTLKPFIYGLAIDQGLIHSASLLADAPRPWASYNPGNFSGGYLGPISASEALQRSLNVPAVELLERLDPRWFEQRLANAGVKLRLLGQADAALALGAASASLEQLVSLYSALSHQGEVVPLRYLADGDRGLPRPLLSAGSTWMVAEMLRSQRRPDHPFASSATGFINRLAFKTGTSYGYRDAWALGSTPGYTLGVWIGRPDGSPIANATGATSAVPLLLQIERLLNDQQPLPPRPTSVVAVKVCWPLGHSVERSASPLCRQQRTGYSLRGQLPPTLRDPLSDGDLQPLVWHDAAGRPLQQRCPGALRATPVALWPLRLEGWRPAAERRAALLPQASCDQHVAAQPLLITHPAAGVHLVPPRHGRLQLQAELLGGQPPRQWYLNGELVAGDPPLLTLAPGHHQLLVVDPTGSSAVNNFTVGAPP